MLLAHRIRLDATPSQCDYFTRAAGTARRVWNWALAEWRRQEALGLRPNAMTLKKQFNAIKYAHPDWLDSEGNPWLRTIHRDAHAQPFAHLARALNRYFNAFEAHTPAHPPVFKKKGRCRDSFYVANDKFRIDDRSAILPKVGRVLLAEALRFPGKIMGASVSREAHHWFLAVQVDVPDEVAQAARSGDGITGVDVGVTTAATLSSGEKLTAPRPLRAALRRLRIRGRRQARKQNAARASAGIERHMPKGTRFPISKNRVKGAAALARLHARIARIRKDFLHKLTTRLCRENQAVAIEDLCVKGMLGNRRLARSIVDLGFYEFRRQLQYKALRFGTQIVLVDRWYPSSRLCSNCGMKNGTLRLSERIWTCACGVRHDRDVNAAINLQRFATGAFEGDNGATRGEPGGDAGTAVEGIQREAGK
jgi:putative transposase